MKKLKQGIILQKMREEATPGSVLRKASQRGYMVTKIEVYS